ncbi:hypothetical protein D3C87_1412420 [compost metagenome]
MGIGVELEQLELEVVEVRGGVGGDDGLGVEAAGDDLGSEPKFGRAIGDRAGDEPGESSERHVDAAGSEEGGGEGRHDEAAEHWEFSL